jgi:hypothetical protein
MSDRDRKPKSQSRLQYDHLGNKNKMDNNAFIPEPFLFNPLKHYLPFIKDFVTGHSAGISDSDLKELTREIRHIGTCVMDIYSGQLGMEIIFDEITGFLASNGLLKKDIYRNWTGTKFSEFRLVTLSDGSQWTLKYYDHESRFVHVFPARSSPHSFRIKANTLKSAVLYIIVIGKDYITEEDLNAARALAGLSPVREVADAEAVTEMIEILRG